MDESSRIQKGEALSASTNTIDGSSETTCLLCFCPLVPLLLRVSMCWFFFPLQHGQCDKTHTHTKFSLYSQRADFITQISSLDSPCGVLINSHFTPFVLSHREQNTAGVWQYKKCACVCVCVHRLICALQFIIQRIMQNLVCNTSTDDSSQLRDAVLSRSLYPNLYSQMK